MTSMLSNWAREFLREDRVAAVSTLNKDGSSHLTTMWYLLADDGTLVMSTPGRNQKVKNLRRDPRIALCVEMRLALSASTGAFLLTKIRHSSGRILSIWSNAM